MLRLLSLVAGVLAVQTVFQPEQHVGHAGNGFPDRVDDPTWQPLGRKIKTVSIIGAGASGLIAAKELLDHGFQVRVFERDRSPGGVWTYSEEVSPPCRWREKNPQFQDYTPSSAPAYPYTVAVSSGYAKIRPFHRQPKHVWRGLHSNAPAPLQQITYWPWPAGHPWRNSQWHLGRYLRSFAAFVGVAADEDYAGQGLPDLVSYNTRVENVAKNAAGKWVHTLKRVVREGEDGYREDWWQEETDAVIIASGRYNSPNVPRVEGFGELIDAFPDHVFHSRNYREPGAWVNKSVLVVGVSISATEISREIATVINHGRLIQSVRDVQQNNDTNTFPAFDRKWQLKRLPAEAEVVPAIASVELPDGAKTVREAKIHLSNGTVLSGLDGIIFGTGYYYSLPYLPQFHNFTAKRDDRDFRVPPIVTDGTHLRSLYLDTFYIPDPTLAIVNLNRLVGDWTFGGYQALAIAKYWSNALNAPSPAEQWRLHRLRVKQRGGYTPTFQFYGPLAPQAYTYFIGWLNAAAIKYGGKQVDTLPSYRSQIGYYFSATIFGIDFAGTNDTRPGYGDQAVHATSQLEASSFGEHATSYDW